MQKHVRHNYHHTNIIERNRRLFNPLVSNDALHIMKGILNTLVSEYKKAK